MGCTAGCLNINLEDEKYLDVFAQTFVEVMDDYLYEPMSENDVMDCFDTDGDIAFALDAEPIFLQGHGDDQVEDFLLSFIKKSPDVVLSGDYYSDYDNCCDIVYMRFEYNCGKLSLMSLYSEISDIVCENCGTELEISEVEMDFESARHPECPECGAPLHRLEDEDFCSVQVEDIMLVDGEWVFSERAEEPDDGEEYLTRNAPDEADDTPKNEDEQAAEDSVVVDAPDEIEPKSDIRKRKSPWWIIVLIIALAAVGAATFYYWGWCLL